MHFLRTELDNIRKNQTGEREDHCNSHIDALVEDHNRAFNEANLLVNQMQQDVDMNMSLKVSLKMLLINSLILMIAFVAVKM